MTRPALPRPRRVGRRAAALGAALLLAVDPALAEPPAPAASPRALYRSLIEAESAREGLPAEVAEAVLAVESGYNAGASGADGEVGLMQVLPSTARMMGFSGSNAELGAPETNIRYGVRYLAGAWRKAGRDLCTAAMKYRAGHGESRFSVLSVNYCLAVRARLTARGYAVTATVPIATFGSASAAGRGARFARLAAGCRGICLKGSTGAGGELGVLNSRLASLVVTVRVLRLPRR